MNLLGFIGADYEDGQVSFEVEEGSIAEPICEVAATVANFVLDLTSNDDDDDDGGLPDGGLPS